MEEYYQPYSLEIIKNKIVNIIYLILAILIVPMVLLSISRAFLTGWQFLYSFHILCSVFFWIIFFLKNKLSLYVKTTTLIFSLVLISISGYYFYGFHAISRYLVIVPVIISGLFSIKKYGYYLIAFATLSYLFFAWLFITNKLTYNFNIIEYQNNPFTWLFGLITMLLLVIITFQITYRISESYLLQIKLTKEQEENYKLLFNQAVDGILIGDNQGKLVMVNDNSCKMFGYSRQELLREKIHFLFSPETLESTPLRFDLLQEGKLILSERIAIRKDGTPITIEMHSQKLPDGRYQAIIRDITERKNIENELFENRKALGAIFNQTPTSMVLLNQQFEIIQINDFGLKLFQKQEEDILNQQPGSLFSCIGHLSNPNGCGTGDQCKVCAIRQFIKDTVKTGAFHKKEEIRFTITKDELVEDMYILLSTSLIKIGAENNILMIIDDITDKKHIEKEIYKASLKSEENERARIAKDLHDGLGPLLSTCKIYLHNLKEAKLSDDQIDSVNKVEEFINDSLIGVKEISNNLSPHILRNYGFFHALKSFSEKLKNSSCIDIEFNGDENKRFDEIIEVTLYRVLTELLINTFKYAQAQKVFIVIEEVDSKICINYTDNGYGFDFDLMMKEPKGLGLYNIQSRISSIGGTIQIISGKGKGMHVKILI